MAKSPAFQFYPKQWLGDDNVMLMDWDARAMHMHYMCIAWQQQDVCTLPDDDEILQKWVGNPTDWPRLKKQIFRAWKLENGRWIQKALLAEWLKQKEFSEKRKKAANAKWDKEKADAHALHMQCSSSSFSSSTSDIKPTPKPIGANAPKATERGTRIPSDFKVTPAHRQFAAEHNYQDPDEVIQTFKDYWAARPGAGGRKLDWDATFRVWLSRPAYGGNSNGQDRLINRGRARFEAQRMELRRAEEMDQERTLGLGGYDEGNNPGRSPKQIRGHAGGDPGSSSKTGLSQVGNAIEILSKTSRIT